MENDSEILKEMVRLYIEEKLSYSDVAKRIGKTDWWVRTRLKQQNVKTRLGSEALKEDLVGQKFGNWTIESYSRYKNMTYWNAVCDCGNKKEIARSNLTQNRSTKCVKCHNALGEKNRTYKGYNDLRYTYFNNIYRRSITKKLDFDLDIEFIYDLYIKQDKKCAISKLPIRLESSSTNANKQSASLDRIDSSKGYTKDNVQWVHKHVNIMKWDMNQTEFIEFCKLIVEANQ